MKKKPIVAILGCGPSGLLAAHACDMLKKRFVIFSRPVQSQLGGAQFSHVEIPGLCEKDEAFKLTYRVNGNAGVYKEKVYGADRVPFVSFDNISDGQVIDAWNLREIYERLWDRYERSIVSLELTPEEMVDFSVEWRVGPIFSSVPLPSICLGSVSMDVAHTFRSQPIRILNEALDKSLADNTIVYDGTRDHSWYRMSMIGGVGGTEWGGSGKVPPIGGLKTVMKPIETNCNCHPNVIRIGRFGTWTKGQLTMHAFARTIDSLSAMERDL